MTKQRERTQMLRNASASLQASPTCHSIILSADLIAHRQFAPPFQ